VLLFVLVSVLLVIPVFCGVGVVQCLGFCVVRHSRVLWGRCCSMFRFLCSGLRGNIYYIAKYSKPSHNTYPTKHGSDILHRNLNIEQPLHTKHGSDALHRNLNIEQPLPYKTRE
jgi:hypothetical protein